MAIDVVDAGGGGNDGEIHVKDASGKILVRIFGKSGDMLVGGQGSPGDIALRGSTNHNTLHLNGKDGNLNLGGHGSDGDLIMFTTAGDNQTASKASIHLDAGGGNIWAGGQGSDGDLVLFPVSGDNINDLSKATVHLDGASSTVNLSVDGKPRIRLEGNKGNAWLGGNNCDGDIVLFQNKGDNKTLDKASIHLDAGGGNIWAGGNGVDGDLVLFPSGASSLHDTSQATIHLDAQTGDIRLSGADCAEVFELTKCCRAEPGSVLVMSDDDHLELCNQAYDKRVVGVVSGAGDLKPGILLNKQAINDASAPVALAGRVYCLVDADRGAIEKGDLLTTCATTGHAMRATDQSRAFGAVIGKALGTRHEGRGLLPVLVTLQ